MTTQFSLPRLIRKTAAWIVGTYVVLFITFLAYVSLMGGLPEEPGVVLDRTEHPTAGHQE